MDDILRFALLGLGLGALYALTAQGIVLIYRGSGVLNFAHGAIGMTAAYLQWELTANHGVPYWTALVAAVLTAGLLGVLTHLLVMRPLRRASSLARLVGTLAVFILLTAVAVKRYGDSVQLVAGKLPSGLVKIGGVTVSEDRFWLLGIAVVITPALHLLYRRTMFGLGTTAVAENQSVASALGWSSDVIAAANWGIGSALAGLTGILIVPVIGLSVNGLTTLLLSALAAALVGRFSSFPVTLAGGLAVGVVQSELTRFGTNVTGLAASVPFLVIALVLVARGQALPLRGTFLERLPALGTGRVRPVALGAVVAIALVLTGVSSPLWANAITNTLVIALIILSVVVLTGYAGQVSLAAYALAGTGAFIAYHAVADWGWPFELALPHGCTGDRTDRAAVRPPGHSHPWRQPRDHHPGAGHHAGGHGLPEHEPGHHPRQRRHRGRQADPLRPGHLRRRSPAAVRGPGARPLRPRRPRSRQRTPQPHRPSPHRGPRQRTGGGGAGDRRARDEAVRLRPVGGDRRARRMSSSASGPRRWSSPTSRASTPSRCWASPSSAASATSPGRCSAPPSPPGRWARASGTWSCRG